MFKAGKITTVLDGSAGSSSKAKIGAYVWKNYKTSYTRFMANTFMENAAHTTTLADGREYIYQCLSGVSMFDYDKQYIGPGAVFAEKTILREIKDHAIGGDKLGIHPNASIVTDRDINYEKGLVDFDGNPKSEMMSANLKIGSTLHGVGAARARRLLRRPDSMVARMVPSLKEYIANTHEEIIDRLNSGESGLGEIAQGWQLSLYSKFWPKVTSRNCSTGAFLDDMLLPPKVLGPVIINFRTYPIRVNSNKYIRKSDGKILTWDEWAATPEHNREIIVGDSGGCYDDQHEVTWDYVSREAGDKIFECTSLTKLPRRCFIFSTDNLIESMIFNDTGDDMYLSINFMNYVDVSVKGKNTKDVMTTKVSDWLHKYVINDKVFSAIKKNHINVRGVFIGTGRVIDDVVYFPISELV